jgi:sterol desaturase/sphingolipid hydroxylase (fatty acid hydroxylase superfamily)
VLAKIGFAFALAGVLFWGVERLSPAPKGTPRDGRAWMTDLAYWFAMPPISKAVAGVGIALVVAVAALMTGIEFDRETGLDAFSKGRWASTLPVFVQALLVLAAMDFTGYWIHRFFHMGRLWPFHAIHHSSTRLDWLAAARVHPINTLLARVTQVAMLILLGFNPLVVAGAVPLLGLHALFIHAAVPWDFGRLRYLISSPSFHRWHHTSQEEGLDRNFAGLFPIWDLLFGTFYMPRGEMPEHFGAHEPVPPGLWAQLWWPFRRSSTSPNPKTVAQSDILEP